MEKMTETNKKLNGSKITAIVVLCVVFCLALFILISSVATVGRSPKFAENPDLIYIYKANSSTSSGQLTDDKEKNDDLYDQFKGYYNDIFSSSFLSALFNGRLSGYTISEREYTTSSSIQSKFSNPYVQFHYDDAIELTYQDGKTYRPQNDSTGSVSFKDIYFEIKEANVYEEFTMYVVDSVRSSSGKTKYVEVKFHANTSNLYEKVMNEKLFFNSNIAG